MTRSISQIGQDGETIAVTYLRRHGYTILSRNWRCSYGEIDIVARQDDILVFVEVKTRKGRSTEAAFAGITAQKRERLVKAAQMYLSAEDEAENSLWRIDAIAIALTEGSPRIEHVEDALDW